MKQLEAVAIVGGMFDIEKATAHKFLLLELLTMSYMNYAVCRHVNLKRISDQAVSSFKMSKDKMEQLKVTIQVIKVSESVGRNSY